MICNCKLYRKDKKWMHFSVIFPTIHGACVISGWRYHGEHGHIYAPTITGKGQPKTLAATPTDFKKELLHYVEPMYNYLRGRSPKPDLAMVIQLVRLLLDEHGTATNALASIEDQEDWSPNQLGVLVALKILSSGEPPANGS